MFGCLYSDAGMHHLLTIMVQLSLKSLLRVAIGAEIKVSSFLSLLIFNVLFWNEPP